MSNPETTDWTLSPAIAQSLHLINQWDEAAETRGSSLARVERRDAIKALGIVYSNRIASGEYSPLPEDVSPADLIAYVDDLMATAVDESAVRTALDQGVDVMADWESYVHAKPIPSVEAFRQARSRGWTGSGR